MNRVTRLLVHFGLSRKQAATLSNTTEEKVKEFESKTVFTQQEEKVLSDFFGSAWEESKEWLQDKKTTSVSTRPKGRKGITGSPYPPTPSTTCFDYKAVTASSFNTQDFNTFKLLQEQNPLISGCHSYREGRTEYLKVYWYVNSTPFCCSFELTNDISFDNMLSKINNHIEYVERKNEAQQTMV